MWHVTRFDPRIHFALNCASRSCPPIGVYDAARIDTQLDLAAASFIRADVEANPACSVRLSAIFKWYTADFGGRAGVMAMLLRYLPEGETRLRLESQGAAGVKLDYAEYDWRLNGLAA